MRRLMLKNWACWMTLTCIALSAAVGTARAGPAAVGSAGAARMPMPDEASSNEVTAKTVDYAVPDVQLVRDDGKRVSLAEEMNDGRAVVLNFIFTTCSSFCPLSSQTFAEFQSKLGADAERVHLMSISVDPEQDTPTRLRAYAHKFGARPGWQHYTGSVTASLAAQRAFGAYRGDKMSHSPLTLLRAANSTAWRRIDGFATPDRLLAEYHQLLASK
jgi:protein SCO1/2